MTRIRVGPPGVRIPAWASWKRPNSLWSPPKLLFIDFHGYFLEFERPKRNVGRFHLAPRLKTGGAIHLLPLYALMTWTEAALSFLALFQTVPALRFPAGVRVFCLLLNVRSGFEVDAVCCCALDKADCS